MLNPIQQFFANYINPTKIPSAVQPYSEHQLQLATAALLVEMTRVDQNVQTEELESICLAVQSAFHLTSAEAQALLDLAHAEADQMTSYFPITRLVKDGFDYDEKVKLIEMMWQVALSDKKLDKYEEHLIRKIANLIYVKREDIIAAKHRAQQK